MRRTATNLQAVAALKAFSRQVTWFTTDHKGPASSSRLTYPVLIQERLINIARNIQQGVSHAQQGTSESRHVGSSQ
jgi:hypothetical protein